MSAPSWEGVSGASGITPGVVRLLIWWRVGGWDPIRLEYAGGFPFEDYEKGFERYGI